MAGQPGGLHALGGEWEWKGAETLRYSLSLRLISDVLQKKDSAFTELTSQLLTRFTSARSASSSRRRTPGLSSLITASFSVPPTGLASFGCVIDEVFGEQ